VTLIVGLANSEYSILIGDRRLTPFGGAKILGRQAEEAPKIARLLCADANVAFGFSGLAVSGAFDVHRWICETLTTSGAPAFTLGATIAGFCRIATESFQQKAVSVPEAQRRLSILFVGHGNATPPRIATALVTNVKRAEDGRTIVSREFTCNFKASPASPSEEPTLVARIGNEQAAPIGELGGLLLPMLKDRLAPKFVFRRAVKHIRLMAKRPSAAGNIGDQLIALVMPADLTQAPTWEYESAISSPHFYAPAAVYTGRAAHGEVRFEIEVEDDPRKKLDAGPKPHRNAPCPCGSGKRYRLCHARRRRDSRGGS